MFILEEREIYNSRLDFFRIEEGAFAARFEAGKAEGLEEGVLKGKLEIYLVTPKYN